MAEGRFRISPLPDEVWAKVSSSCEITSPEHVVEGLMRNALDADASSIVIEAELSKGYLSVCDNGSGINKVEFSEQGHLAKLHCSSKLNGSDPTYGRYGRFLSNLSFLSLLSIASQHRSEPFANRLILHRGDVICRQLGLNKEELGIVRQGTVVTVHNLFGDVPVRSKQLSLRYSSSAENERAFSRIKEMLVGYVLAQPRAVEVRFSAKGKRQHSLYCCSPTSSGCHFSLESTISTLFQAKLVTSLDTKKWRSASVRTSHFCIRAAISIEPSPSKTTQFISVGKFPVRRGHGINCLFDTIDRLCQDSSFGYLDLEPSISCDETRDGIFHDKTTKCANLQKGVDRWLMFHIQIDPRSGEFSQSLWFEQSSAEMLPVIDHLTKAVESLVSNFLAIYGNSAGAERRRSRMGRDRTKHEEDSCRQLLVGESASENSQLATEARYLSHWHRVKSARPLREDFRYGLGLRKSDNLSWISMQASSGGPSSGTLRVDDLDLGATTSETQFENENETVAVFPWINSRNGQVVYLHPRTGLVMPMSSLDLAHLDRSRGRSPLLQNQTSTSSNDIDGKRPRAKSVLNLHRYLRRSSLNRPEAPIACIMSEEVLGVSRRRAGAGRQSNTILHSQSVTKGSLSNAIVIQQVDRKFILVLLAIRDEHDPYSAERGERRLLVLIDQHAADERAKFEKLCGDFCKRTSTSLTKPLVFEVDETEAKLLEEQKDYFRGWCVSYYMVENPQAEQTPACSRGLHTWRVEVTGLPDLIVERCRAEPKLLVHIMRSEIWLGGARRRSPLSHLPESYALSWWSDIGDCPRGMIEMLRSRSCRTAVMFNDPLDSKQCRELVQRLSQCTFPFQCAHGRPTFTVLADLDGGDHCGSSMGANIDPSIGALGFGDAWKAWVK
ncbi:uncharacterized protein Z519_01930 [Cladophialophora bantiana CBS 173.52]|uniref:MutL C-terminal dimerisation domain-containing protein n=1 Tax=Cladophialophora bantiana (strain ATCC 10958 / CBS 173.52 / CDC B-1940 / NIH 8579) TaxID=1442370 RepID=A0A0D2IIH2_CLAB1|nr:uncharacterized protein Z519_01930 [Cladophialophora bantiana CBS 173.52]KIW96539.1 hypothetical protein Z519_01930 [Cladophialophora bantiana CBS 173.52]